MMVLGRCSRQRVSRIGREPACLGSGFRPSSSRKALSMAGVPTGSPMVGLFIGGRFKTARSLHQQQSWNGRIGTSETGRPHEGSGE